MNFCTEITSALAEAQKFDDAADAYGEANGCDREYYRLRGRAQQMIARERELRRQAAQEFATLNGWRWVERPFLARTLARGGTHEGRSDGGGSWGMGGARDETMDGFTSYYLFDHPLFFREIARPYCTAAIVGQPFHTDIADAHAMAAKIGLVLHVPPNSTSSWWCPGWTRFFCLTRPEITRVQFLPEQLERSEEAAG